MHYDFAVSPNAAEVVEALQTAGYETYIVGGAIRDMLLGRRPKDFDISTSATPEEVRVVFGRRRARIIGKRFRLAHVTVGGELFEVSTFRKIPTLHAGESREGKCREMPENMILSDNSYGTSSEDAFRRDFTVNALFYDPVRRELIDCTGQGMADIGRHVVRAIGDPALRFEEDPVRMLRALKLVAQFDFSLDCATENALFASLPLLEHVAPGRLALELEKILKSDCCDRHLETFFDYGLLTYFLPALAAAWGGAARRRAVDLLYERGCRVTAGIYRDSISLALAALALPFAAEKLGCGPGKVWERPSGAVTAVLEESVTGIIAPQTMMIRVRESACQIMQMQCLLEHASPAELPALMRSRSYGHARELLIIRTIASGGDAAAVEAAFPPAGRSVAEPADRARERGRREGREGRRPRRRFRRRRPEVLPDESEE